MLPIVIGDIELASLAHSKNFLKLNHQNSFVSNADKWRNG